jgi:hypothetical protein
MINAIGSVKDWDRHTHRGTVSFDSGDVVEIHARDIGAARRRPAWRGTFELHSGDRVECVRNGWSRCRCFASLVIRGGRDRVGVVPA